MSKPDTTRSTAPTSAPTSAPSATDAPLDLPALRTAFDAVLAPWVRSLGLALVAATPGEARFVLPVAAPLVHGGGVLCGQAMMAACDTAMIAAVMTRLGGFKPMTTVQLQTSFLRPVAGDAARVELVARVLRMGRNLVFGEVQLLDGQGQLAAHATTTYALL
jgi:uncharacterized protein (TIGR00369 family)